MSKLTKVNAILREEREILKNNGILRETIAVKYVFMGRQRVNHSSMILCHVVQVSKAGFMIGAKDSVTRQQTPLNWVLRQGARIVIR